MYTLYSNYSKRLRSSLSKILMLQIMSSICQAVGIRTPDAAPHWRVLPLSYLHTKLPLYGSGYKSLALFCHVLAGLWSFTPYISVHLAPLLCFSMIFWRISGSPRVDRSPRSSVLSEATFRRILQQIGAELFNSAHIFVKKNKLTKKFSIITFRRKVTICKFS